MGTHTPFNTICIDFKKKKMFYPQNPAIEYSRPQNHLLTKRISIKNEEFLH